MNFEQLLGLDWKQIKPLLLELDNKGLLENVLPELTNLKGVERIDGQGHKDNFIHTLQVIENTYKATTDKKIRLVSILHDIGKAPTKKFIKGQGWTFSNHEYVGGKMLSKVFNKLELPEEYFYYVKKLVTLHGRPKELTKNVTESALRRFAKEAETLEDLKDLILFCKCDITTKFPEKLKSQQDGYDNVYQQILEVIKKDKEGEWRCPINGHMIIEYFGEGVKGRVLGNIKQEIESAIKSGKIGDNYDEAFEYMKSIKI